MGEAIDDFLVHSDIFMNVQKQVLKLILTSSIIVKRLTGGLLNLKISRLPLYYPMVIFYVGAWQVLLF